MPEKLWDRLYSHRVEIHVQSLVPNQAEGSYEQHLWSQLHTPHGQHWPCLPPSKQDRVLKYSAVIWESTWFMEGGTGKLSIAMDLCFRAPHLEFWCRDKLMRASCGAPNSRLALIRRGWEGCSPVQCPTPGNTFSPMAVQHFHPHLLHPDLMLVPFPNNPKSGSSLFVQYTCIYSRAQLAGLRQQNFAGCTAEQCTVTDLYSGRNLQVQRGLSAEWLDASGTGGGAMNKVLRHLWCQVSPP